MMRPAVLLVLLSAVVIGVMGQTCPGAKPPPLTSAQSGAMNRARTLGYVPSDTQVNNAVNVQRIKRLLSQDKFNYLFPMANMGAGPSGAPYNYQNFLKAAAMFPDFCNNAYASGNLDTACLTELSTMFSMFAQETGAHIPSGSVPEWRQGLYFYTEVACTPPVGSACAYCQSQNVYNYPCVSGKYYYGRGPFQLSWNYNYGYFSYVILGDAYILLNNPDQLTTSSNSWLSFASALWFYMTPQNPKPSMHDVATGYWIPNSADTAAGRRQGFGAQIMIINGGLECGGPTESSHAANRISYFQSFTSYFGINPGSNLGCANMRQFDSSGSAAIPQNWERSWSTNCACQLVSYVTAWSIYDHPNVEVPYQNCLNHYFGGSGGNPGGDDCSKLTPCSISNNCKSCKAVASCTDQWVTDEHCANCNGGQSWWPCNLSPAACYCF